MSWMLLHGTPFTPAVWTPVARRLRRHGRVSCPWLRPAPRTAGRSLQADLATRVLEHARDAGPVHLVGHSFGGQIALEIALAAPERVASLTVVCSRATPFPAFTAAATAMRAGGPVDGDATLHRWFRPDELTRGGPVVRAATAVIRDADPAWWADTLEAIGGYDRSADLHLVAAPTTLIAADGDQVSPPTVMAAMAERLPHATTTVLADAMHLSPFTRPDAFAQVLLAAAQPAAAVA